MSQLGLPFSLNSKMLLDNFIGIKNQQIKSFLRQLFEQKTAAIVYIYGNKSSGKTHLLQGLTNVVLAKNLSVVYVDFEQYLPAKMMSDFATKDWVCLDNIDNLNPEQQAELFTLYNNLGQINTKIIVSAASKPHDLPHLKDLKTRLSLSTLFALEKLDDDAKKRIITAQIQDRNILINPKIFDHLFKFYSRDLKELLAAIDLLDQSSLSKKTPITIPLIKQILSSR